MYLSETPYKIIRCHHMKGRVWILRFEGVLSRPEAEALRGIVLLAPPEEPRSAEGSLYYHQLVGLGVYTRAGKHLGLVSEILETGSNDVYVISGGATELLIPATESVVVEIDLSRGVLIVDLPEGLL